MTIGKRIKEERERLGFNQDTFAEKSGVSRRSQIMYEQDKTDASASYFTKIATIGADVNYILTGVRTQQGDMLRGGESEASNDALSAEEVEMLRVFNLLDDEAKKDALRDAQKIYETFEIKKQLQELKQLQKKVA